MRGAFTVSQVFDMDTSEDSVYGDFMWAAELNRICLELVGVWPTNNDAANFASDLRIACGFILATVYIIPLVCSLIRVWGNMLFVIENLQVTLPVLIILMKVVIMRWKRTAFRSIVKMMDEDWIELKTDAERYVMVRQARTARLIAIGGYFLTVSALTAFMVSPLFGLLCRHKTNLTDGDRALPLQTYYFYDVDKSPQFEIMFIIQAVISLHCGVIYTSVDAFLGIAIFHICGQLENFRYRLINLALWKDFDSALRNNVENHLRLIRFAGNIEDMFALLMLGLVLLFAATFCMYAFLCLNIFVDRDINKTSLSQLSFVVCGGLMLLIHTFLYCGAGELVAQQCEAVYHAMYELHWYKLESAKAKVLVLLMIRANEPFHLTAGKIFPLTMTTFCSLLKTSAGYISFLLAKRS